MGLRHSHGFKESAIQLGRWKNLEIRNIEHALEESIRIRWQVCTNYKHNDY